MNYEIPWNGWLGFQRVNNTFIDTAYWRPYLSELAELGRSPKNLFAIIIVESATYDTKGAVY